MAAARSPGSDGARRAQGFSLIEVLVALAIFAVLASVVAFQSGAFGNQLFRLEEKTVALWVAQNALDAIRVSNTAPPPGSRDERVEMAGKDWVVNIAVSDTARPGFRRVDVSVSRDDEEATLVDLTGFVSAR